MFSTKKCLRIFHLKEVNVCKNLKNNKSSFILLNTSNNFCIFQKFSEHFRKIPKKIMSFLDLAKFLEVLTAQMLKILRIVFFAKKTHSFHRFQANCNDYF